MHFRVNCFLVFRQHYCFGGLANTSGARKGCRRHLTCAAGAFQLLKSGDDINDLLSTLLLYYKIIKTTERMTRNNRNKVAFDKRG